MSLESELQEISGVGEATASKIMELVQEHGGSETFSEEDLENLRNGIDYVENGNASYAMKFFNRVDL